MSEKNVNYGINFGYIGDQLNIYQYFQIAQPLMNEMLGVGGANNHNLRSGHRIILMLELFNSHFDNLEQEFKKATDAERYPLKIRVTQLVDDCAQGVYNNNGNVEKDVWKIVDSIITLMCVLNCGSNFYANRVRVGNHLYYEFHPTKE